MSADVTEKTVVDEVEKRLLIGGEWRDASGSGAMVVEDPSTAEPLCEGPPLLHLRSVRTRRVPQHPARRHKAGDQAEVQYHCITL
jgi:hypothetical protein